MKTADQSFASRHIGPNKLEQHKMLKALGLSSLDELVDKALPPELRFKGSLDLPPAMAEASFLQRAQEIVNQNKPALCCMGQGYYGTHMPSVIERQILENPAWYTAYTPYQSEISQGRLEALLNFQHMVVELTGMQVANSSLLDEGTALAEAVQIGLRNVLSIAPRPPMGAGYTTAGHATAGPSVFVDRDVFTSSQRVLSTRLQALGVEMQTGDSSQLQEAELNNIQVLVLQYPRRTGELRNEDDLVQRARKAGVFVVVTTDLLALTLLKPPGEWARQEAAEPEWAVQAVVGSSQRFGVPMGYGGPAAAFLATLEKYKRQLPGRVVGVSEDVHKNKAFRLALQTREQHIRRERATSNICTAQVLPAVLASMYAVYHGPDGLKQIARRVHQRTCCLAEALQQKGFEVLHFNFFDTLALRIDKAFEFVKALDEQGVLVSALDEHTVAVSLDETTRDTDVELIIKCISHIQSNDIKQHLTRAISGVTTTHRGARGYPAGKESSARTHLSRPPMGDGYATDGSCQGLLRIPSALQRTTEFCTPEVFHQHHSETQMLRYMAQLEAKDISLRHSMIPLGSCTMKLNAASELKLLSLPKLNLHPHTPRHRTRGYQHIVQELEQALCELTGFKACSLQPNAGAQGEFLGLLLMRRYHQSRGQGERDVCLIPQSAHGTNPASARMAGLKVVQVRCDDRGNIDVDDLKAKAQQQASRLAGLMITYPSTHGVFEASVREVIECVHQYGGQVYMDGANLNALVALCRPGDWGVDVGHVNLHKTFCIPHGGGGPGVGPVLVAEHLKQFLPPRDVLPYVKGAVGAEDLIVTSSPFGSASILPISWAYIAMMGAERLEVGDAGGFVECELYCASVGTALSDFVSGAK